MPPCACSRKACNGIQQSRSILVMVVVHTRNWLWFAVMSVIPTSTLPVYFTLPHPLSHPSLSSHLSPSSSLYPSLPLQHTPCFPRHLCPSRGAIHPPVPLECLDDQSKLAMPKGPTVALRLSGERVDQLSIWSATRRQR